MRELGLALGLPHDMVFRHPFPGPGLGVRILGEVKREYADLLRRADAIFIDELRAAGWYEQTAQAFAVFLPVRSVGVMGDGRTYEYVVALRAVQTVDFMTAQWAELPHALLSGLQPHHQRSARHQPRRLRHLRASRPRRSSGSRRSGPVMPDVEQRDAGAEADAQFMRAALELARRRRSEAGEVPVGAVRGASTGRSSGGATTPDLAGRSDGSRRDRGAARGGAAGWQLPLTADATST